MAQAQDSAVGRVADRMDGRPRPEWATGVVDGRLGVVLGGSERHVLPPRAGLIERVVPALGPEDGGVGPRRIVRFRTNAAAMPAAVPTPYIANITSPCSHGL